MKQVFHNLSEGIIIFHVYKHNNISVTISNIKSLQQILLIAPLVAPPMIFLIFSTIFGCQESLIYQKIDL